MTEAMKYCKKCNTLCSVKKFYKTKNSKAYPDGTIDWCKTCMSEYKKSKKIKIDKPSYRIEQGIFTFVFD